MKLNGSIRLVSAFVAFSVITFFSACSNYQEEFDNNFGALEYADDEGESSPSGGDDPQSSPSGDNDSLSSSVPTSSGGIQSSSSTVPLVEGDSLNDVRDGKKYKLVTIGDQMWMAENLNFETEKSRCYDNSNGNCLKYGRLYTWADAQSACPEGTHLPTDAEMKILEEHILDSLNRSAMAGAMLKSEKGWADGSSTNKGYDFYGFTGLPAGVWKDGKYVKKDSSTVFWSADEAIGRELYYGNSVFARLINQSLENGFSVRCLVGPKKAEVTSSSSAQSSSSSILPYTPPSGPNYDTLDYNGQKYRTVKIGDQEWMAENMNAKVDGSACYRDSSKYCDMYGRLYKWEKAKTICPEGWRLPDTTDWTILFEFVGGKAQAATRLKATTSWTKSGDGNGDDAFGFSAFAAGGAKASGSLPYQGEGNSASFWTIEKGSDNVAWSVGMYWSDAKVTINETILSDGLSVRCLKDAKPLSSSSVSSSSSDYSSSGEFTDPRPDNGGSSHIYPYVKYNGLVWMDEDLSYRTDQMEMGNFSHPLYSWKSAQEACPPGWRLPTIDEFNNSNGLEDKVDLRSKLGGYFLMTNVHKAGNEGMYWTQSSKDDTVYAIQFSNNRYEGSVIGVDKKVMEENSASAVFAVRCVTESLAKESPRSSSSSVFISRETYLQDSGPYATVTIGGKKWMAQNLNYYGGVLQLSGHTMLCRDKTTEFNSCDGNGIYYDYWSAFDIASMDAGNKDEHNQAWTLPNSTEATALLEAVENAGRLWSVEMNGTNESGFYAFPSGYFSTSDGTNYEHQNKDNVTCYWLWSGNDGTDTANALCFYPKGNAGHEYSIESRPKTQLFPLRLIYSSLRE